MLDRNDEAVKLEKDVVLVPVMGGWRTNEHATEHRYTERRALIDNFAVVIKEEHDVHACTEGTSSSKKRA